MLAKQCLIQTLSVPERRVASFTIGLTLQKYCAAIIALTSRFG